MTTKFFKDEICDYFSALKDEYNTLLRNMIFESHYRIVREIIEQNTDIYSIFHYDYMWYDEKKDEWYVTEISTKDYAIINSNKELVTPFTPHKNTTFLNGIKHEYFSNIKNKNKLANDSVKRIINNLDFDVLDYSVKNCVDFCKKNIEIVKRNTLLLENSSIPHSIFDYKKSLFFTNNRNKRYFALQQKDSGKWGLVDYKGDLIAPFIYDDIGSFVVGEGEYIHMIINGKCGLLDCLGNIVVEPISDDVVSFYEGLAIIKQDKKFGYIDSLGKIAIPIIYDDAKAFNFGKAEVQLNGETFYINRKGEALLNDSK